MPATPISATPSVSVSVVPSALVSDVPTVLVSAIPTAPILTGPSMSSSSHPLLHFFIKVQPAVDAIDTRTEALRKEVADLEGCRERLLSSIGGSSHFGDQPLNSGLH
ncbi:hypothetical protein SO802_012305 [Lithocarpus litseifolius]|uniref:Uncharacterized protein n=1 Tax=Lithocarpus litseifolius TaxID=425828 RepID=A0AAW2D3R5_9ROSI